MLMRNQVLLEVLTRALPASGGERMIKGKQLVELPSSALRSPA